MHRAALFPVWVLGTFEGIRSPSRQQLPRLFSIHFSFYFPTGHETVAQIGSWNQRELGAEQAVC